jgi:non-specific serine/threonine protein kinase
VIALHAVWSRDSQLCVWGEDPDLPARAPRRRGRRPAKPQPRKHPFACSAPDLAGAFDALGVSLESDALLERELHLMLPSFDYGPQHSPQLLRVDEDRRPGSPELLDPWVVPAIGLGPAAALELLLALPTTEGAPQQAGLALGDSLRFLAEASKLALELVARGRLLPGLARREEGWVAWWRAVTVDPDDAERVRMLVAAMPPLVRAEMSSSEEGNAPEAVVGDLLGTVVDACARSFLVGGLAGRQARRRSKRRLPVIDAWVAALTDTDPVVIDADERELAALAEEIDEWRQAGERYAEHRMFRTCFRLCEPEEPVGWSEGELQAESDGGLGVDGDGLDSDPWRVEFLLQAKDDPSVLVPAEQVWSSNGSGLKTFGHRLADPQERLLGGLGHALRLWPDLEPALRDAAPTGIDLAPQAAIGFVRDAAPALEQAGFGVLAPPWWNKRLRLKLKVEPFGEIEKGSGLFGLDGLCAYEWRIAVGDATLSLAELRELAALKLPLVMARGRWIVLRPEDVEAALAFFERRAERGQAPAGELIRESLGLGAGAEAKSDSPAVEIEASGWLKELLGTNGDRKLQEVPTPATFEGELRPYQQRGLAWLSFLSSLGLGACLADDMGLGKTVQLLALLLAEREHAERQADGGAVRWVNPKDCLCPSGCNPDPDRRRQASPQAPYAHVVDLSDVGGGQLGARGAAVRAGVAGSCASRPRAAGGQAIRARGARERSRDHDIRACHPRPRHARRGEVGADRARRGAEHQDDRHQANARDPLAAGPSPRRAHGHSGREPPDRASLDHGLPQPGAAGPGGDVQALLRDTDRALSRRARHRASATGDRPVHPAPPEDRQADHHRPAGEDRDARRLPSDQGAGEPL